MILAFASEHLRTLCEGQIAAEREYGIAVAQQLRARLADMRDAENVKELVAGNPHEIASGSYEVSLLNNYRIVLLANHDKVPLNRETGQIDWSRVSRIQIHDVEKVEDANG